MKVPTNGVATSDAAAASIQGKVNELQGQVLAAIRFIERQSGAKGATCDQIEAFTKLAHQTASARVYELRHLGVLVDSGERRRTRSGRSAIVWVLASAEPEAKVA